MEEPNDSAHSATVNSLKLTSLKGIPRIFKVETALLRGLWVLSVISFLCTSLYFVFHETEEYLERSTIIDFKEIRPTLDGGDYGIIPSFPKLVLCNLKPVHTKGNSSGINLMEYLDQVEDNMTEFTRKDPLLLQKLQRVYQSMYAAQSYFEFVGKDHALSYGQTVEDFIVACTVTTAAGQTFPCDFVATYKLHISPTYINCYDITINEAAIMRYRPRSVSVILHLSNADDYIHSGFSRISNDLQHSGALLTLDSSGQGSSPCDVFLSPGTLTKIGFETELRIGLPSPYGNCEVNPKETLYGGWTGKPIPYTQSRCMVACIQKTVSAKCQCLKANSEALASQAELQQPYCAASRDTFEERLKTLTCDLNHTAIASEICLEHCPSLCRETRFKTQISSSSWPRVSQEIGFYKEEIIGRSYERQYDEYKPLAEEMETKPVNLLLTETEKIGKITKNFMKFEVTMQDSFVKVIETKVKKSLWDSISAMASFVNMFSGITVIVFVEFIDYLIHIFYVCYGGHKKSAKTAQKVDEKQGNGVAAQEKQQHYDFNVYL